MTRRLFSEPWSFTAAKFTRPKEPTLSSNQSGKRPVCPRFPVRLDSMILLTAYDIREFYFVTVIVSLLEVTTPFFPPSENGRVA
jgi:hypothetical protein